MGEDWGEEEEDGLVQSWGWRKSGLAVIMMRWRRGYAVAVNGQGGEGDEEVGKKGWWRIFLVGVGSISNLYFAVGDINELDLRPDPMPAWPGLAEVPEEEIELVDL